MGLISKKLKISLCSVTVALWLSACMDSSYRLAAYTNINASPEVLELIKLARSGDKRAQLELGVRFEEGDGVPISLDQAIRFYRYAANDTGGIRPIFVPGRGLAATIVSSGRRVSAEAAARARVRQAIALKNYGYPMGLWPKSYRQARHQSLSKLRALIAICEERGGMGVLCRSSEFEALREAAKFESRFTECRVRERWGNAGRNPRKFDRGLVLNQASLFNMRSCIIDGREINLNKLDKNSNKYIWLSAYVAAAFMRNPHLSEDDPAMRDFYINIIERSGEFHPHPDSIMAYSIFEMTRNLDVTYVGSIAGEWWGGICRSYSGKISPFEKSICRAADRGRIARVGYDYNRYGHY